MSSRTPSFSPPVPPLDSTTIPHRQQAEGGGRALARAAGPPALAPLSTLNEWLSSMGRNLTFSPTIQRLRPVHGAAGAGIAGSARKHAAWWPERSSTSGGSSAKHRSNAFGQRVLKRQPWGGSAGLA